MHPFSFLVSLRQAPLFYGYMHQNLLNKKKQAYLNRKDCWLVWHPPYHELNQAYQSDCAT